ncbi:HAD family hydrolase [Denitratisoma sp. agr-D3]
MHAVAFDFDGTLVDSAPGILKGMALALAENRLDPVVPLRDDIIGPPLRTTLALISGSQDAALLDRLTADFKRCYDGGGYRDTRPYPGIDAALRRLHEQGTALYLATNKRGTPTRLILDHFGWTPWFAGIYCLDEHPDCAGKKQMLGKILGEQRLPPARTPYVGDTEADADAAGTQDMPYLHVAWGYGHDLSPTGGLTCVEPEDLPDLLARLPWN